ncbi:beta-ketoacyl-ACP synthase 3 [Puniceicoccaceae bacterium K14]|nr:beta-ketoacyl-ACP synthase 3 [Puniceicoccaceae bacterium K14]
MSEFLIDLPIPSMGATVNEMTLIDLLLEAGESFVKGDKLAELESDKSVFDFEAPCDGAIEKLFCRAGDIIEVGSPFMRVKTSDSSLSHLLSPADESTGNESEEKPSSVPVDSVAPLAEIITVGSASGPATKAKVVSGIRWTPRAKKLAQDNGLDVEKVEGIVGTGPGGRVSGDDVVAYLEKRKVAPTATSAVPSAGDMESQTVCVAGIGYALPKNVRSNQEILKAFPGKTEEEMIKVTGIRQRYVISDGESATSLAVIATRNAIEMSGLKASDIDAVIVATLLADQPVPGAASCLAKELGIGHALAFDLNAACSGWLYALEVGRSFIRGRTAKNVLVVTAEILSTITNPKDPATAFLFGDGAGAAILTPDEGGHRLYRQELNGDSTYSEAICRPSGGALKPIPQPGDNLDNFYLQMDGGTVFKRAVIAFADLIESAAKRHGLTMDEISWVVPHQPNERILKAVAKRVGIPFEKFVVTVGKYGNTSAASVSMALGWAAEEGIFEDGDKIIFCSVGAGFTFAGGLMVW